MSRTAMLRGRRLALELLESRLLLTAVVGLRFEFDASSTPFSGPAVTSLVAGNNYTLNAYIRDNRSTSQAIGVQQAYFNISYTSSLLSIPAGSTVNHGAFAATATADISTAGVINEVGGQAYPFQAPSPANQEVDFFSVPIHIAPTAGRLSISTSLDPNPDDVVEFFNGATVLSLAEIEIDGLALPTLSGTTITGTVPVRAQQ